MSKKDVRFLLSAFRREHWPAADCPEVAFVGRSNVGKSSCLNSLVGRKGVARVSKTPGRTQAINFFDLQRGGAPVRFADLPGYGFAKVPKSVKKNWDAMVGEYLHERASLALVVVLVDMRRDPTALDREMVEWLERADRTGLLVLTKSDRIAKSKRLHRQSLICKGLGVPREASVVFSSPERTGRKELWDRIDEVVRESRG
ncbi:MAG: ribosome biogenesis GTP-binding protein YihA/YsxC [Myxococcota bacterium]|nr:ribosome biogenesis GTP-binding protein YihA/YsxC [Myxococcota bacterium]